MLNKKNLIKLSLWVMAVGMMWMPLFSSAQSIPTQALNIILKATNYGYIKTGNISPIHFRDNENNFWGFIYFSNTFSWSTYESEWNGEEKKTESIEVSDGTWYECKDQVKWFYYDSQRGERLWPLDEDTKTAFGMRNLELSGGMYTNCVQTWYDQALKDCADRENSDTCKKNVNEQYSDGNGYYGHIYHEYKDKKYNLIAWVNYKTGIDWVDINSAAWLAPTFIRYNNQTPLGLIYDTNGWVGFVWCYVQSWLNILVEKLMGWSKLAELFKLNKDDVIESDMGESESFYCDMAWTVKDFFRLIIEGVVWMSTDTDADQTKEQRRNNPSDKTQLFDSANVNNATLINYTKQKAETLCRGKWKSTNLNSSNDNLVCLDTSSLIDAANYKNKTLVVKWWASVKVKPLTGYADTSKYDIFIDGGNLLIEESYSSWNIVIWKNGFMTGMNVEGFNDTFNDNGKYHNPDNIWVASVLRWNFIVNGKVLKYNNSTNDDKKLKNKYFIYGKLTSLDTVETLKEKFVWFCNNEWMWSDGYVCPDSKYQGASLSVIDQNYPSPLQ